MPGSITSPIYVLDASRTSVVEVIDNATFSSTVSSAEIDFSVYRNFIVTYVTGTGTGSMIIRLYIKDSNGNWIQDPDYVSSTITTSTSGIAFKGYLEAPTTIKITCTWGSGSFANTTVNLIMKS